MSRFLAQRFSGLLPYTPGEQPQDRSYIKLNTNESPFPPSPAVVAALSSAEVEKLNLYSDPEVRQLRRAVADVYGLVPAQVLVGNGSDEILAFSFQAFCGKEKGVCFPDISYGFYPVYAKFYGLDFKEIPLSEDFRVQPEAYYGAGRTVFLANPNAPTGVALPVAQIAKIVRHNPGDLVVIDEAYVDFGGQSAVPLIAKYENLLVIQTFSKSRSLAGMRLGLALGNAALIEDLEKMRYSFNPYNVDRLAILAGTAAMKDTGYFEYCRENIIRTREKAAEVLRALGFSVLPSSANFLFARHPAISGGEYYLALKKRGILVRHFKKARIDAYVRITIGTQEQMDALMRTTRTILEEKR